MLNSQRRNFVLALILFFAWVGALAVMARYSAQRPRTAGLVQVSR